MNQLTQRLAALALLATISVWSAAEASTCTICKAGCQGDMCYNAAGSRDVFLRVGQNLTSPNGRAHLIMQDDGNLVLYCTSTNRAVWATHTRDSHPEKPGAMFKRDGNIIIFDMKMVVRRYAANSHDKGGAKLVMQDDANLVIYTNYGKPVWASGTKGRCGGVPRRTGSGASTGRKHKGA